MIYSYHDTYYLNVGKDTSEAKEFVDMVKGKTMKQMTIVTCMGTLNKNMNDGKAISSLVIGELFTFILNRHL